MPTITTVDATWDTGVAMDAAELRRADTAVFLGDGTANGVRGGIVRHGDTSLAVSVNGSDQVTVQPGAFVIPAATGLGVYRGSLAAATQPTALAARNATNPRIDLITIQATGTNATVKTIDGTPGASPSAPALPAQHIELARVTVPAVGGGAVTVDSTWRAYATGLGGDLYVETAARLPASGNQKKQRAIALDTGTEHSWDGSAWGAVGEYAPYTVAMTNWSLGNGTLVGRSSKINKTRFFRIELTIGSTTTFSGILNLSLPTPANWASGLFAAFPPIGDASMRDISVPAQRVWSAVLSSATTLIVTDDSLAPVQPTTPWTWAAGDVLMVNGHYEEA